MGLRNTIVRRLRVSSVKSIIFDVLAFLALLACAQNAEADGPSEAQAALDATCQNAVLKGQEERDSGHLIEARRYFLECTKTCFPTAQNQCAKWLVALEPRIPSVVISLRDSAGQDFFDAQLILDGAPVVLDGRAIPLDPGTHDVTVSRPGSEPAHFRVLVFEGEKARPYPLKLPREATQPPPAKPQVFQPEPQRQSDFNVPSGAWILGGAGVASLLAFGYFALDANSQYNSLQDACAPDCDPGRARGGERAAIAADVTLGVGVAAVLGAVVWTWVSAAGPSPSPRLRASAAVGGGSIALQF